MKIVFNIPILKDAASIDNFNILEALGMPFMTREFILTGSCCLYTGSLKVALEELPELDWGTAYGLLY